jgi:hypothetical protein
MLRYCISSLIVAVVLLGTLSAQDETPGPKPDARKAETAAEKPEVEVHFVNGSLLRLAIHSEKLDIATEYGKLSVPVKDIRSIEFGLRFPAGVEEKIGDALRDLGSGDFRTRDKASAALVDLGPYSYPGTLAASRAVKDLEVSRRAKDVLKKLEAKYPKKLLKTETDDKLVTRAFPIAGRITTPSLKATTDLFGEVDFALAKMDTLRAIAPAATGDITVTIDAAKYAIAGKWMETSVEVDGRVALTITAKGSVDTWPQQPNQWMAGPAGNGGGGIGGRIILNGQLIQQAQAGMSGGALFGRIGESGEPFFIGERYSGTPAGDGKLYLTIGPSQWGSPSTGSYEVKITR